MYLQFKKYMAVGSCCCNVTESLEIATEYFDKRDAFSFFIVCMPHLDSNIPSHVSLAVAAKLLRTSK